MYLILIANKTNKKIALYILIIEYSCVFQAVSDLLLGVFCMPFTLIGQVLRNFVFGAAMCKLISFFQGKVKVS
jgi:hypothetical protein